MRVFTVFCFCWLAIAVSPQTKLRTFTSPDRAFQFQYSPVLIRCTQERGSWIPGDACSSQGGLCEDTDSPAATIACFAYPKTDFKDKPTFSAAAFFVAEVPGAATAEACLAGTQDWLIEGAENTKINSIRAKLFHISDNWLSGGETGDIYRVFHAKKCYELGVQEAHTSSGAFDPGTFKEFTQQDSKEVTARLTQALNSFTFIK
jgi:hypothetical protein